MKVKSINGLKEGKWPPRVIIRIEEGILNESEVESEDNCSKVDRESGSEEEGKIIMGFGGIRGKDRTKENRRTKEINRGKVCIPLKRILKFP